MILYLGTEGVHAMMAIGTTQHFQLSSASFFRESHVIMILVHVSTWKLAMCIQVISIVRSEEHTSELSHSGESRMPSSA